MTEANCRAYAEVIYSNSAGFITLVLLKRQGGQQGDEEDKAQLHKMLSTMIL